MDNVKTRMRELAPLRSELLLDCKAMAKWALDQGLRVPPAMIQALDVFERRAIAEGWDGGEAPAAADTEEAGAPVVATTDAAGADARQLAQMHARLSELVAPAKPATILLLTAEAAKPAWWQKVARLFGPVPLVRRLMAVAALSLVALVLVSLSEEVSGDPKKFSLLLNDGWSLLLNQIFLLSAASLGAAFANLFQAQRFIREGTFDPTLDSTYWSRWVLGLMAGTILAQLIPIEELFSHVEEGVNVKGSLHGLEKPTLALLGGFSVRVVYRVLNKAVSAVESLVRGDTQEQVQSQVQAAKAELAEKATHNRMELAAKLAKLQQRLLAGAHPDELRQELERFQHQMLFPDSHPEETGVEVGAAAPPAPARGGRKKPAK